MQRVRVEQKCCFSFRIAKATLKQPKSASRKDAFCVWQTVCSPKKKWRFTSSSKSGRIQLWRFGTTYLNTSLLCVHFSEIPCKWVIAIVVADLVEMGDNWPWIKKQLSWNAMKHSCSHAASPLTRRNTKLPWSWIKISPSDRSLRWVIVKRHAWMLAFFGNRLHTAQRRWWSLAIFVVTRCPQLASAWTVLFFS